MHVTQAFISLSPFILQVKLSRDEFYEAVVNKCLSERQTHIPQVLANLVAATSGRFMTQIHDTCKNSCWADDTRNCTIMLPMP